MDVFVGVGGYPFVDWVHQDFPREPECDGIGPGRSKEYGQQ